MCERIQFSQSSSSSFSFVAVVEILLTRKRSEAGWGDDDVLSRTDLDPSQRPRDSPKYIYPRNTVKSTNRLCRSNRSSSSSLYPYPYRTVHDRANLVHSYLLKIQVIQSTDRRDEEYQRRPSAKLRDHLPPPAPTTTTTTTTQPNGNRDLHRWSSTFLCGPYS
jgi:hypothetical protein